MRFSFYLPLLILLCLFGQDLAAFGSSSTPITGPATLPQNDFGIYTTSARDDQLVPADRDYEVEIEVSSGLSVLGSVQFVGQFTETRSISSLGGGLFSTGVLTDGGNAGAPAMEMFCNLEVSTNSTCGFRTMTVRYKRNNSTFQERTINIEVTCPGGTYQIFGPSALCAGSSGNGYSLVTNGTTPPTNVSWSTFSSATLTPQGTDVLVAVPSSFFGLLTLVATFTPSGTSTTQSVSINIPVAPCLTSGNGKGSAAARNTGDTDSSKDATAASSQSGYDGVVDQDAQISSDNARNDLRVEVFPNPATSFVTLSTDCEKLNTVRVFNLEGRELITDVANAVGPYRMDISTLNIGTYAIRLETDCGTKVQKLLVQ